MEAEVAVSHQSGQVVWGPPKVLGKEGGMFIWRGGGEHIQCNTPRARHRIDRPGAVEGRPSSNSAHLAQVALESRLYFIPLDPERSPTSPSFYHRMMNYVSIRLGYGAQLFAQTPASMLLQTYF